MQIPDSVKDVLRVAAPTLLSALLGPLGGLAATIATAGLDAWLGPAQKPPTPPGTPATPAAPLSPEAVVQTVRHNLDDPELVLALKKIELDLQQYERNAQIEFARLEQANVDNARKMATDTGMARTQFRWGMGLLILAITLFLAEVAAVLAMAFAGIEIDPNRASLVVAAFGFVGTVTGYVAGWGGNIVNFYWGSSQGSKEKTDQLATVATSLGTAVTEAAKNSPPTPQAPVVVVPPAQPTPSPSAPAQPAMDWQQGPYGGVRFRLDADGYLVVEGEAAPGRTVGEPATVRRIWRDFGPAIEASCARNGVPLEIVVATIATESRGIPAAALTEPDGRTSVGLMQVLLGTAEEMMGRKITAAELADPLIGIEAGVRYIAKQYSKTKYLPPLVAAAYNAGGLYPPREQDKNRWNLRSTGNHIDRLVLFYNDARFVAQADGWSRKAAA